MFDHADKKPFTCTVCKFGTTRQWRLDNHMNTHTGNKPFGCPVCKTTFATDSNIDRHIRTQHPEYHAERKKSC